MNIIGLTKVFGGAIIGYLLGFTLGKEFEPIGGTSGIIFVYVVAFFSLYIISQTTEESL